MIPASFVQDLLARTDIADVIGAHVVLRRAGANLQGLCPFHNEKSPSFSVSPSKQFYHCFGCGESGTALGFLMAHSGYPFPEAVEQLALKAGMTVPRDTSQTPADAAKRQDQIGKLLSLNQQAQAFYKTQLKGDARAVDYLKRRGLTGEIAAKYGLGYAPDDWQGLASCLSDYVGAAAMESGLVIEKTDDTSKAIRRYDRFRDRVMFPIRNTRGEIIGFGGRIIDAGEPKYLNSPETPLFNKGQEVYGLFEARPAIRAAGYALVTEGYMDVVALAQLGFAQAVATLGTAVGAAHIAKLFRHTDHIIFAFDGDKAGRKAAWRALEASLALVTDTRHCSFLFLPAEHDPDSYIRTQGTQAFEQAVRSATPLSKFLSSELSSLHDTSSAEGRAALMHQAKPMLQAVQASALRRQLTLEVARVVQMNPADIEHEFSVGVAPFKPSGDKTGKTGLKTTPTAKAPLVFKANLDGSYGANDQAVKPWQTNTLRRGDPLKVATGGTLAAPDSRAKTLGLALLNAPEHYAQAKPWLQAWTQGFKGESAAGDVLPALAVLRASPKGDELLLLRLMDELDALSLGAASLNPASLSARLASPREQDAASGGTGLDGWLAATVGQVSSTSPADMLRLAAALREAQLKTLCNLAAQQAGVSPAAMQRYKDLLAAQQAALLASREG